MCYNPSMNPQLFVREFFAIAYFIVGLSHLIHPRLLTDHFRSVLARPDGPFLIALYAGPLGLTIVLLHNVWVLGIPVIVTLVGWGMLIKAGAYLLCPGVVTRLAPEKIRGPKQFVAAGIACLAVSIPVGIDVLLDLAG